MRSRRTPAGADVTSEENADPVTDISVGILMPSVACQYFDGSMTYCSHYAVSGVPIRRFMVL
jgi:hypothetical protein